MHRNAGDLRFAIATIAIIVVTHAAAYLTHEYAHSFTAWWLGFMHDPLAIDYGRVTPANVILLAEVGDNVPYGSMLAGGHGRSAAVIALAGATLGNALPYVALSLFAHRLRPCGAIATSVLFWLMLMCAGNIWSYVPIRSITTHADIAVAANGLGVSVLAFLPFVLLPSLMLVGHFFVHTCPLLIPAIAGGHPARTSLVVATTAVWFFVLFGGVGLSGGYGSVSQTLSLVSALALMPLAAMGLWERCARGSSERAGP